MIPECFFAVINTDWLKAPATHVECNFLNFIIIFFNMCCQFLQMQFTFLVQPHTALDKYTVHVAFEIFVFVYLAITKLLDCFYKYTWKNVTVSHSANYLPNEIVKVKPSVTPVLGMQIFLNGLNIFNSSGGGH